MSDVAPGWYSDPTNPLQERLWDGSDWVGKVRPKPPVATAPSLRPSRHDMVASTQQPVLDLVSKSSQTRRISGGAINTLIALAIGTLVVVAVPRPSVLLELLFSAVTDKSSATTDNSSYQGVYAIGDVGPGGGRVFITPSTSGNTTGLYFEAAPYADETKAEWCSATGTFLVITGTAIGTGESNTATADATCTSGAVQVASDYYNNGLSDWFLPSKDELNELYVTRGYVGGFSDDAHWSSSESVGDSAWRQSFYHGNHSYGFKGSTFYVRPVRSFS